ncbi:MAG TPA: CBS domain-containing protein [Candidatus Saccharimonadales bacterium]
MRIALAIILAVFFLLAVLLDKTLRNLPAKELRRRARAHQDKRAAAVYKLAAFNRSAELFLRLLGVLSAAGLILLATDTTWWVGLAVALVIAWLMWTSRLPKPIKGWRLSLAALAAPFLTAAVSFFQPILGRITDWSKRVRPLYPPTSLYEKEDLLEFLRIQARQPDNRISEEELKTARGALSLNDKTVSDIMLPRRKIKWVAAGEAIGPMLMDELHQSRQTRFPVVKEVTKASNPEIVGTLYLKDLLDQLEDKGRISGIMHPGVGYINESQNLRSALDGFLKSGQLLLVVVNNFEEVVGAVTLEDVLQQILVDKVNGEFDRYHDIRSVASHIRDQTHDQDANN